MAETETIARMAEKVSDEVFSVFGWELVGPLNQNWPCEDDTHRTTPTRSKTHPTDVVFRYEDPYKNEMVHLNTDLKSYKSSSISLGGVAGALRSLAQATRCANLSGPWQEMYLREGVAARISGMLFVYNHDGMYDRSFGELLRRVDWSVVDMRKGQRLHVLGPDRIAYLVTVANDIQIQRGKAKVSSDADFWFFYPDLIGVHLRDDQPRAATVETLCGPLLVAMYRRAEKGSVVQGALVYYSRKCELVDEFKYLIDYLFRYQLLIAAQEIKVRLPRAVPNAPALFNRAVDAYVADLHGLPEIRERLARISVTLVPNVIRVFSEVEIGMER